MGVIKYLIVLILELDMVRICVKQLQFQILPFAQYLIHLSNFIEKTIFCLSVILRRALCVFYMRIINIIYCYAVYNNILHIS